MTNDLYRPEPLTLRVKHRNCLDALRARHVPEEKLPVTAPLCGDLLLAHTNKQGGVGGKKNRASSRSTFVLGPLLVTALTGAAAWAGDVREIKASEVAALLAQQKNVVIQATSPDRSCGYCVGADKAFDAAAALSEDKTRVYARVQWSPWRQYPDFGGALKVLGVPAQFVFRNGKLLGEPSNHLLKNRPAEFEAHVQALLDGPDPQPHAPAVPPNLPAATPAVLSEPEQRLARLWVRQLLVQQLSKACGQLHTGQQAQYQAKAQRWEQRHKNELNEEAARLQLKHMASGNDMALRRVQDQEKNDLQAWQVKTMGVPMNRAPSAEECGRLLDGLAAMD